MATMRASCHVFFVIWSMFSFPKPTGAFVPCSRVRRKARVSSHSSDIGSSRTPRFQGGAVEASSSYWNEQAWAGSPSYPQRKAGIRSVDSPSTYPNRAVPLEQGSAPLVRYSSLTEQEKAQIESPTRSSLRTPLRYREWTHEQRERRNIPSPTKNAQVIQGGSRGTWSTDDGYSNDRVQVTLETDGRPLQADLEVWKGPGNVPQKMRLYTEDGRLRPFTTMIETPDGAASNSISVKNTGPIEFPIIAGVQGIDRQPSMAEDYNSSRQYSSLMGRNEEIHGGTLRTYAFDPSVGSVEVEIRSQGLPIMAVVELWQGPGDVKTIAQVYSDDGHRKPFSAILETPGTGNTIAIRNVGPTAYPIEARLDVFRANDAAYSYAYNAHAGW